MNVKIGLVVLLLFCAAAGAAEKATPCPNFKGLLDAARPNGMDRYMLQASLNRDGNETYENLDADGDDISDKIVGGCPASLQTADSCTLNLELSTGKKQFFSFPAGERFFLFRYRGRIYAAASPMSGSRQGRRTIYSLDRSGITQICKAL